MLKKIKKIWQDCMVEEGKFNIPNTLTVLRILSIPVIVWLIVNKFVYSAAILFGIASLSDLLDGIIARWRKAETLLGKWIDPIADKLLVLCTLPFAARGYYEFGMWFALAIIYFREIVIMGGRIWVINTKYEGIVEVSWIGKWKSTSQYIGIGCLILHLPSYLPLPGYFFLIPATALAGIGLDDYLKNYRAIKNSTNKNSLKASVERWDSRNIV